jgi:endonuclease/exonuclease/phosphatase family metal-dependent hydrolase
MKTFVKYTIVVLISSVLFAFSSLVVAQIPDRVRVAAYNIQFLNTAISQARRDNLKEVIRLLNADVIALNEIDDRASLAQVFPPDQWQIVIDDDSANNQDVAVVVRRPLEVRGMNSNLNADDQHFLFPSPADNDPFPDRRDVLKVEVGFPGSSRGFFILAVHAKSRREGRDRTEGRRVRASRLLVQKLRQDFDDKDYILLGDFNDNPDDRSLNILESGDPDASFEEEERDGPFLINLMEPLVAAGHVSHGREELDIISDRINTIDSGSRARNRNGLGTNNHTGDILFDQMLISMGLREAYVGGSAKVFDRAIALSGGANRASDHLPVFADFAFGDGAIEPPSGVRIVSLLPNPDGTDAGREEVTIGNFTSAALSLNGWTMRDRTGSQCQLSGLIPTNSRLTIRLPANVMPLGNNGDEVELRDNTGTVRHKVSYTAGDAVSGRLVVFQ